MSLDGVERLRSPSEQIRRNFKLGYDEQKIVKPSDLMEEVNYRMRWGYAVATNPFPPNSGRGSGYQPKPKNPKNPETLGTELIDEYLKNLKVIDGVLCFSKGVYGVSRNGKVSLDLTISGSSGLLRKILEVYRDDPKHRLVVMGGRRYEINKVYDGENRDKLHFYLERCGDEIK